MRYQLSRFSILNHEIPAVHSMELHIRKRATFPVTKDRVLQTNPEDRLQMETPECILVT